MNPIKLLLSVVGTVVGYKILPYDFGDRYTKYRFCDEINENLKNTSIEVMTDFNKRGFTTAVLTSDYDIDVIPICNENMSIDRYGYATFINKIDYLDRSISISNLILDIKTTLWNVMYHELLHTVGLGHSKQEGLMNYTVTLNRNLQVIPDENKLYPSQDDIDGLDVLYDFDTDIDIDIIGPKDNKIINKKIIRKLNKICALLN